MVGGYALRYALGHPAIGLVTAIGRRMLGISHPKLKEVLHPDFADSSAFADALSSQNAAASGGVDAGCAAAAGSPRRSIAAATTTAIPTTNAGG